MANTYIRARSPKGNVGVTDVVDAGELSAYSAGVLSGFTAKSASSWTLQIGGVTGVQDVAIGKNPSGESELFSGTAGQSIGFVIGGAPGTPGQSRTDALVIYKDPFTTSVVNNGVDVTDYQVVAGTAATTGSQVPPNDAAIRAAIPTGSLKFVTVIGYVTTAYGASGTTVGAYSRGMSGNMSTPAVVANITERNYLPLVAGMKCFQVDNAMEQICDGTSWNNIPRLLKKTELTSVGDQLSAQSIPIRNSLTIRWFAVSSGVIHPWLRINNDGANRYSCRYRSNTTDGSAVNQSQIPIGSAGGLHQVGTIDLLDYSGLALKQVTFSNTGLDGNIAIVPSTLSGGGAYNQSTAITRLDINNMGAGDFGIGSYIEIWG